VHVLVATDGRLTAEQVSAFVVPLTAGGGTVTVLTVVEVPHSFLAEMRAQYGEQGPPEVVGDNEYVGVSHGGKAPFGWPGDLAMIDRYRADKKAQRCMPLVDALRSSGVSADSKVLESEQTARAILDEIEESGCDLVVIGSHGQGFFEGLLGSTGTKIARQAPCGVLLVRNRDS
jgi:nucleotide-binding universal stress UspA family protein